MARNSNNIRVYLVLRDSAKRNSAQVVLEHLEQTHTEEEVYRVFADFRILDDGLGLFGGYHLEK